jgi:hypothetical protein
MMTSEDVPPRASGELPAPAIAQLRWLVAALRTEDDEGSGADREQLARRLELALIGAPRELAARLAATLAGDDSALLTRLATRHEELAYPAQLPEERTAHRGRARRYRDIAQFLRLLPG